MVAINIDLASFIIGLIIGCPIGPIIIVFLYRSKLK